MKRLPFNLPLKRTSLIWGAGIIALLIAGFWALQVALANRAVSRAENFLAKGFGSLAVEAVDCYRYKLIRNELGCKTLIGSYFLSRKTDRLEWAAQACLEKGINIPELYIGLAASREFTNRDQEALQVLLQATTQFPESPDLHYRIAQLLRRNKKDEAATSAYLEASKRAPQNNTLTAEALEYFSSINQWPQAKQMADLIRNVPTENPELKLLLGRAYLKTGDTAGAGALASEARSLLARNPSKTPQLERLYADVLQTNQASAPVQMNPGPVQNSPGVPQFSPPRVPAFPMKPPTRR